MRWFLFICFVFLGAFVGVAAAHHDDMSTKLGMAFVGALFASPVGAVISRRRGSKVNAALLDELIESSSPGSPSELSRNYWRDRGHPPFMKPSDSAPDKHMFDPDRLS